MINKELENEIDDIISEVREENIGKPEQSFIKYKQKIINAIDLGKDFYDNNKSIEYNIAFISDSLEMAGYDFEDYQFEITILVIKYN